MHFCKINHVISFRVINVRHSISVTSAPFLELSIDDFHQPSIPQHEVWNYNWNSSKTSKRHKDTQPTRSPWAMLSNLPLPKKSPVSQTGPTISHVWLSPSVSLTGIISCQAIQGRAYQIIHRRINNRKIFAFGRFQSST